MNGRRSDGASPDRSPFATDAVDSLRSVCLFSGTIIYGVTMTIALDTNVLWPLLRGDKPAVSILTPLLDGYNASDGLVVCGPVYAELLAGPGATVAALTAFLATTEIVVDVALPLTVWQESGLAFRAYAERRVASGAAWPRRVLADFIIGTHALHNATALMTLNRDDFVRIVPSLPLIVPNLNPARA